MPGPIFWCYPTIWPEKNVGIQALTSAVDKDCKNSKRSSFFIVDLPQNSLDIYLECANSGGRV